MTAEMVAKLRRSLILHEGMKNYPYVDTEGNITIGIGYNISARGLDDEWINTQYNKDVNFFYNRLYEDFDWFKTLNLDRQIVLVDMAFMGYKHFCSFKKMIDALSRGDYFIASKEMLDSEWGRKFSGRATQLAKAMLTGSYEI